MHCTCLHTEHFSGAIKKLSSFPTRQAAAMVERAKN